ncbi:hypothetical protein NECAME_10571 [Necator americanus]|uniref:Uncharacterized protein n=1 Tax=Necator americanus TaxID=51031 RepID=W2TAS8_NECAM|nr:hypothetical protein NECAME_10571 [Necator americanus]ETN78122.1 hypothetical protein NECAME_10571 [Necator americanus]
MTPMWWSRLSRRCGRRRRRPPLAVAAQMSGRLRIASHLFRLILLLNVTVAVFPCEREIPEDICPQREGFDKDCELRCQREYPHRLSSGCHLRSTGTLLSFFGIKSFICKCHLPEQFCAPGHAQNVHRRSFSLRDLATHSTLVALTSNAACSKPSKASLTCRDEFGASACAWQRLQGEWYVAEPHKELPFAPGEAPVNRYLVAVAKGGTGVLQLDTCPALCSVDSLNVTAKIWRGPWVNAELCFKYVEQDATMCAPLRISNGRWINEVIPQTSHFQISFKFTNVSDGDVILLDDVSAKFTECPAPARITSTTSRRFPNMAKPIPISMQLDKTLLGSSNKKPLLAEQHVKELRSDSDALKKRFCREGECTTIVHHATEGTVPNDRMCIGRVGLLQCREKCISDGAAGKSARCVRQHEFPFHKRCLCQVRRSPMHRVDGGSRISDDKASLTPRAETDVTSKRALLPRDGGHIVAGNAVVAEEEEEDTNICAREDGDEVCNRQCRTNDTSRSVNGDESVVLAQKQRVSPHLAHRLDVIPN